MNSYEKHGEAQPNDQQRSGSGREHLCERVEERLAALQKRCASSGKERRWLPGL